MNKIRLMTLVKQLTTSKNDLSLRALFDMSRDSFASECGYAEWTGMKDALGVQGAKATMSEVLGRDGQTLPASVRHVVNLVTDTNGFRSKGNSAAHAASWTDISQAVESMPMGRDRQISLYLLDRMRQEAN